MTKVMRAEHEHLGNHYIENEFDISCALKVLLTQLFLWSVCFI